MCAVINENNKKEDETTASNSNSLYGGFYRRFNSIFRFEIEYRTIVLSRRIHLIDLGRWSALLRWLIHLRDTFYTHKYKLHKYFFTGRMIRPAQPVRHWSRPNDPAPAVCERPNLSVQVRMIRPYPGWSGPGTFCTFLLSKIKEFWVKWMIRTYAGWSEPKSFRVCFSLFCCQPGWFEVTPDVPELTENTHNSHLRGLGCKYPLTPSFTPLSTHDQPSSKSIDSSTLLHPKAWFLQGFT